MVKTLLIVTILCTSLTAASLQEKLDRKSHDDTYIMEDEKGANSDYAFGNDEASHFSSVGFYITGGSIRVNAVGGFADGEYKLKNADIASTDKEHNFIATLHFVKKKGAFSYGHEEKLGILYDGQKLWIKHGGEVYRYSVPTPVESITSQDGEMIRRIHGEPLEVEIENMHLRFEF